MSAGRVWKFGDNINTDLMLPGSVIVKSARGAGARRLRRQPPRLGRRQVDAGDVIVGGRNFGMGSNRPAARSLRNIGVGFLLAETINGLFFRNSVNFGFLALECPGVAAAFAEGDTAELSIETDWTVRNRAHRRRAHAARVCPRSSSASCAAAGSSRCSRPKA